MKKIKQMRLKAILLTIVAVLTLGFTSCTDELGTDQTQGKPGYLTINVKTLQPKQTKMTGVATDDYKNMYNLHVFILRGENVILHKYFVSTGTGWTIVAEETDPADQVDPIGSVNLDIPVSELNILTDKVVVLANYGNDAAMQTQITQATTLPLIEAIEITTVRDVSTLGLHMTGIAKIVADGGGYASPVKVAPVESKITVKWNFTDGLVGNYTVTGVYVVNAITKTQSPMIRENFASVENKLPAGYINFGTRTAATGYTTALPTNIDFNIYSTLSQTEAALLSDVDGAILDAAATGTGLHYYVGENYSNNVVPTTGTIAANSIANAGTTHANTIVLVKVTPTSAGALIYGTGDKYYTYEFTKLSAGASGINNTNLGAGTIGSVGSTVDAADQVGFSVRRKTNYNLTFNLSSMGASQPFQRVRNLRVNVEAQGWDDQVVSPTF